MPKSQAFLLAGNRNAIHAGKRIQKKLKTCGVKRIPLAENPTQKSDAKMELAKIYARQGKKSAARDCRREAADLDNSKTSDVYSLIGGMYMNSF